MRKNEREGIGEAARFAGDEGKVQDPALLVENMANVYGGLCDLLEANRAQEDAVWAAGCQLNVYVRRFMALLKPLPAERVN